MFICDAHCDTIERLLNNGEGLAENSGHLDMARARDVGLELQFFAAWIDPKYAPNCAERATNIINKYHEECAANMERIAKVRSGADMTRGKLNAVLTIEGGSALEGDMANLQRFWDMGVRLMTLTWNGSNELSDGAVALDGEDDVRRGLTEFGREVVREMVKMGMIIDVSHLSERGFWDVLEETNGATPIFATHSNCKKLAEHPRNLTDEQIKTIIHTGGFIGLNFYPDFLGEKKKEDITRHAAHFLELGAEDSLGFGADFDGVDCLPNGIEGLESMGDYARDLEREFGAKVAEKIAGENLWAITQKSLT
ncbi:peptidase [Clostridia bacterium]|nr:peptidase [Clostridia bacterium]